MQRISIIVRATYDSPITSYLVERRHIKPASSRLALSHNPKGPPYLGLARSTDYLLWVLVRVGGPAIGVGVQRDRTLEVRARQGGFFSLRWSVLRNTRFVSGWRGDPEASLHTATSQEHASMSTTTGEENPTGHVPFFDSASASRFFFLRLFGFTFMCGFIS